MKKILILLPLTVLMAHTSCAQDKETNKLSELYKEIKTYKEQPQYWIFIHSNNCSYVATINDMPIYTDYNDGDMTSLSFPLNPLLPYSGAYALKITLLPKQDDKFNLASTIEKNSGIQIKISKVVNKTEKTVLDETVSINEDSLPSVEKTYSFSATVPYSLRGWSESADLKKEDAGLLEKEVADFYQNVMHLYEKKELTAITDIYYEREQELAQSLYSSAKKDSEKLVAKLSEDIDKGQKFKLEDYRLQFYANGKVVGLVRKAGQFLGKSAFVRTTKERYYLYSLLLHRPKPGAPLEVIR